MERASFLGSGAESHPFSPPAATCPLPDTRDHLPVILLSPKVSVCAEAIGIKPSPGLAQAENTPFSLLAGTNRERCGRTAPGNGAAPGSSDEPFRARLEVLSPWRHSPLPLNRNGAKSETPGGVAGYGHASSLGRGPPGNRPKP